MKPVVVIKVTVVLAASLWLRLRRRQRRRGSAASQQLSYDMHSASCASHEVPQHDANPCSSSLLSVASSAPNSAESSSPVLTSSSSYTEARTTNCDLPQQGACATCTTSTPLPAPLPFPAATSTATTSASSACSYQPAESGFVTTCEPHAVVAVREPSSVCTSCCSSAEDLLMAAVRSPVASPVRTLRSTERSQSQRPLLPTPPPAGASGLRAIRRTVSAAAAASAPGSPDTGLASPSSPRPMSVRARAAQIERRCGFSCDSSPWSSPAASRPSSARCLFPASPSDDCWSGYSSGTCDSDSSSSVASSVAASPRTSCSGASQGRASWGRSSSCKASLGGEGASFLPFARASHGSAFGSPSKPNMPRIQGL